MATYNKNVIASFGVGYTGLVGTVGYTVLSTAGATYTSRTTAGVTEWLAGTGIYKATLTLDDTWEGIIVWDTGGVTPIYAVETFELPSSTGAVSLPDASGGRATIIDISEVILEMGLSAAITDEERAVCLTSLRRAAGAVRKHLGYDPTYQSHTEYYPLPYSYPYPQSYQWDISGDRAVTRRTSQASSSELQLRHLPVRSVVSVYEDVNGRAGQSTDPFPADTLLTAGTDYWLNLDESVLCTDGILRAAGTWPSEPGSVKVAYAAGYTAAEIHGQSTAVDATPIGEAVLYEACRRVRRMMTSKKITGIGIPAGVVTSERLGDYGYTLDPGSAALLMGSGDLTPETKEKLSPYVNYGYVAE